MNSIKRFLIGCTLTGMTVGHCLGQSITHPYAPSSPTGASDQQAQAKDLAGKRGQQQVDLFTGSFGYSIPISCAPGRDGSQPALTLVYSSGGENGWCGVGWKLDIGYIQRNTKDGFPITFTAASPPGPGTAYDNTKGFILNLFGREIRLLPTTGNEYRPEVDTDFLRCVLDSTNNKWTVYDKSGNVYYFGQVAGSRVVNPKTGWSGSSGTFHWALDQIDTATGDRTTIAYTTYNSPDATPVPERILYPTTLTYNGHANINGYTAVFTGLHTITFTTDPVARPDRRFSYRWGFRTEQNRRLTTITSKVGSTTVSRYDLAYGVVSPATGRSLLRSVIVNGFDSAGTAKPLPTQTFTYQGTTPLSFGTAKQWQNLNLVKPGTTSQYDAFVTGVDNNVSGGVVSTVDDLVDIDGDGLPDRVSYDLSGSSNKKYQVQRNLGLQANGNGSFGTRYSFGPTSSGGGTVPSASNPIADSENWAALNAQNVRIRDINGDGLPDRVCDDWRQWATGGWDSTKLYDHFTVMTNTGTGFYSPSSPTTWTVDPGPTGIGNDSIFYSSVESGGINTGFFDINGDGLPDRVMAMHYNEKIGTIFQPMINYRVQFNTGSGFTAVKLFGPYQSQNYNSGGGFPHDYSPYPTYYWTGIESPEVHMIDINGDGLPDRVMFPMGSTAGTEATAASYYAVEYNNGYSFEAVNTTTNAPAYADKWLGVATQSSSQGIRYDAIINQSDDPLPYHQTISYTGMYDVNGDGLPDRVVLDESTAGLSSKQWKVYLNNGRSFDTAIQVTGISDQSVSPDRAYWSMESYNSGQKMAALMDVNGDGLLDRVMAVKANVTSASPASPSYFSVQLNNGPFPDLLTGIDNGIGGTIAVSYKSSSDANAGNQVPFPVQVVNTVTENDGVNGNRTMTYAYAEGFYNGARREFAGFGKVTVTDPPAPNNSRKKVYFFHQGGGLVDHTSLGEFLDPGAFAKKGMTYRVETYGNEATPLLYNTVVNQVDQVSLGSGRYFPYVKRTFVFEYPGGGTARTTATEYNYASAPDNLTYRLTKKVLYGEVNTVNLNANPVTFNDSLAADTQYHQIIYATIVGNASILDRPGTMRLTSDLAGATVLQETQYTYNTSSGTLATEQHLISPGQYAVTTYAGYDVYGLPTLITDPVGVVTKVDGFEAHHIYPTARRLRITPGVDGAGDHVTATTYDPKSGVLTASTDPMGVSIRNVYDAFFRLTESYKTPYNGTEFWVRTNIYALGPIASGSAVSYLHVKMNDAVDLVNGVESRTYLDGFSRPIQTRTESETGSYRVVSTAYDERGEAFLTTWPRFETGLAFVKPTAQPAAWTGYDAAGRISQTRRRVEAFFDANGVYTGKTDNGGDTTAPLASRRWAYAKVTDPWWIVCTDEDNKVRRYGLDGFGRTNIIEEVDGANTYTTTLMYDRVGNLTDIKDSLAADAVIHFGYDGLGNQVALSDPHLGAWTYKRDRAERIREQVDAKGQKVEFLYNATLMRLGTKNVYNAAGQKVSTATYTYDTGDANHTVYKGLLFQVTDSEGWEKNGYDTRGRLQKNTRHLNINNRDYVTTYTYNDADKVTSIVYPNSGPTINYSYLAGGSLSQVSRTGYNFYTATAASFDEFGHVVQFTYGNSVVNNRGYYAQSKRLSSLTAGASGSILNKTYQYTAGDDVSNISGTGITYDDLHRIKTYTGLSGYTYDSVGNIKTSGESGNGQTYNYGNARNVAVKTVTAAGYTKTYAYDLCGNTTVRRGDTAGSQALGYDSENRLTKFSQAGTTALVEFGYAADGTRLWKRKNQAPLQVWIGSIYEEKGGKTLFHVFAGGERICTFEPTSVLNGGPNPSTTHVGYYYHQDHLNSSSALSGNTGAKLEGNVWYPFGRTQTATPQAAFKVSNQFTGQVVDEETGLYYYNARYYDPELGRFIQPDTIISDLGNPQSYNRYSYVLNNPLRYTDPDGHWPDLADYLPFRSSYLEIQGQGRLDAMVRAHTDFGSYAQFMGTRPNAVAMAGDPGTVSALAHGAAAAAGTYITALPDLATAGLAAAPAIGMKIGRTAEEQAARGARLLEDSATGAGGLAKSPHLNGSDATSNFGLYEIETPAGLEKVGKADLNRVTQSSGLPTRLHQQVRKLEKIHGQGNVKGTVVEDMGVTTTRAAKTAENTRIKTIVDETGQVPPGNQKSYGQ